MPRGIADIPELRIETMVAFVTRWMSPPELYFSNLFPTSNAPSSSIKWESQEGTRGMTPFKPAGAPSPLTAPIGIAQHSAEAAFWGEKMFFDEEFLNNLRKEGTIAQYLTAAQRIARELGGITNRSRRRKEWLFAKMIVDGGFDYQIKQGNRAYVTYGIPSDHTVTLGVDEKWSTGANANILANITTGKRLLSRKCGARVTHAICNSQVLQYLGEDATLRTLLSKSTFGDGTLFSGAKNYPVGINPAVISSLLDIPNLVIIDTMYEVRAYLTAAVTGSSTTAVSVEDASDFEVGGTLKFVDASEGTYEEETISAVDEQAGTVTVSSAPTASFKPNEDYVSMVRPYVPDDKFIMMCANVDGKSIAEYWQAPFGLDRHYGEKPDRWEIKDPDGIYIRIEDKGLPVLYQRDALYILDVA